MAKILVVEDDQPLALSVADSLGPQGYLVDVALAGADARAYFSAAVYDLVIIDWELPDVTGLELCREIRSSDASGAFVLFLTARAALADKEQGFESGADDYLTKPFHMSELLARVKALLRRPKTIQSRQIKVRDIVLDTGTHEVFRDRNKVELFPREFALLEFMMRHPNQIFSADALLRHIWPTDAESSEETVRVTMMRVRQKLGSQNGKPLIVTLRSIGYRLES